MEALIKDYILKNGAGLLRQLMPMLEPEIIRIIDSKIGNNKSDGINALVVFVDLVIPKESQKMLMSNPKILAKLSDENIAELRVCASRISAIVDSISK